MKRNSFALVLSLVSFILVISFLVYYFGFKTDTKTANQTTQTQPIEVDNKKPTEPTPTPTTTPTSITTPNNGVIYKNDKYGFELTLPNHWAENNYKVSESSFPNYSVISFSFQNGHQPFSIIQLIYMNKDQLAKAGKNTSMKTIYEDEKGTLFCDSCCSLAQGFTGGGQFDEFQVARCEEVPDIIKTFKKN